MSIICTKFYRIGHSNDEEASGSTRDKPDALLSVEWTFFFDKRDTSGAIINLKLVVINIINDLANLNSNNPVRAPCGKNGVDVCDLPFISVSHHS